MAVYDFDVERTAHGQYIPDGMQRIILEDCASPGDAPHLSADAKELYASH